MDVYLQTRAEIQIHKFQVDECNGNWNYWIKFTTSLVKDALTPRVKNTVAKLRQERRLLVDFSYSESYRRISYSA